ncbi:MAG: hypothetical protein HY042_01395 [Spirochaetia bacterium]|nr:hypothetical protein [Spirochaetia bacterium]
MLLLLEDIHIDLVLFSMTILFLGSLLFQAKLRQGAKRTWIMLVSISALAYVLTRPLVIFAPITAPLVTISGLLLHLSLFAVMIIILVDLYGKRAHDLEAAEGGSRD